MSGREGERQRNKKAIGGEDRVSRSFGVLGRKRMYPGLIYLIFGIQAIEDSCC